jgi:hypothetical protein
MTQMSVLEVAYIWYVKHDITAILKKFKEATDDKKRLMHTKVEGMLKRRSSKTLKE